MTQVFGLALRKVPGFNSQAKIQANTRQAGAAIGPIKMERPEWYAIDPKSGQMNFTLTSNSDRTASQKANPCVKSR